MDISLATDILRRGAQTFPLDVPGGCNTFVEHPCLRKRCVSIDIVIEHRYAFSAWVKNKINEQQKYGIMDDFFYPPDLLTFDWHNDVGGECDFKKEHLQRLNQKDENEVGLYCWAGLRSINDGHIAPAMWINAIGDVYAVIKQDVDEEKDRIFKDRFGNIHTIRFLKYPEDFVDVWTHHSNGIFWDIDLDYFTELEEKNNQRYTPMLSDEEVANILDIGNEWVEIVLTQLRGITIALEPEYTGGLTNSLHIFKQWEKAFFNSPLFSKDCCWKKIITDLLISPL